MVYKYIYDTDDLIVYIIKIQIANAVIKMNYFK